MRPRFAESTLTDAPLARRPSIDKMVLRYFAAFGPASAMDVQAWCGLTRLREVVERLRPQLVTFRDERGVELFDVPDAPRPDPETPAPVRFLPQYDNVFLSHADRSRIASEEARGYTMRENGFVSQFLLDGFIAGTWRLKREGKAALLRVTPARRWPKRCAGGAWPPLTSTCSAASRRPRATP